jgi:hypothetical protein
MWLAVIPQLIAMLDLEIPIRGEIHELLNGIASLLILLLLFLCNEHIFLIVTEKYPDVIIFPLIVAQDSQNSQRKSIAHQIINKMVAENNEYNEKHLTEEGGLGYVFEIVDIYYFYLLFFRYSVYNDSFTYVISAGNVNIDIYSPPPRTPHPQALSLLPQPNPMSLRTLVYDACLTAHELFRAALTREEYWMHVLDEIASVELLSNLFMYLCLFV